MAKTRTQPTPPAPEWLKGAALAKWNALWPVLDRTRIKPAQHGDTVAAYCQAAAEYAEASKKVGELGGPVVLRKGGVAANPYAIARDTALKTMTDLGKALGLAPNPTKEPDPEWADYAETLLPKRGSNSKKIGDNRAPDKKRKSATTRRGSTARRGGRGQGGAPDPEGEK